MVVNIFRARVASATSCSVKARSEGESGARREAVLWNAAVALTVEGSASDVADGYERAAHAIDGGAATVLEMPLNPNKTLDHLVLRATARDVVVGLMSITLLKTK